MLKKIAFIVLTPFTILSSSTKLRDRASHPGNESIIGNYRLPEYNESYQVYMQPVTYQNPPSYDRYKLVQLMTASMQQAPKTKEELMKVQQERKEFLKNNGYRHNPYYPVLTSILKIREDEVISEGHSSPQALSQSQLTRSGGNSPENNSQSPPTYL